MRVGVEECTHSLTMVDVAASKGAIVRRLLWASGRRVAKIPFSPGADERLNPEVDVNSEFIAADG